MPVPEISTLVYPQDHITSLKHIHSIFFLLKTSLCRFQICWIAAQFAEDQVVFIPSIRWISASFRSQAAFGLPLCRMYSRVSWTLLKTGSFMDYRT